MDETVYISDHVNKPTILPPFSNLGISTGLGKRKH